MTLRAKIKNSISDFNVWLYEFHHGHPFLLREEADIIVETRLDPKFKWMNEAQIQSLVKMRIRDMYKRKFPQAKKWSLL